MASILPFPLSRPRTRASQTPPGAALKPAGRRTPLSRLQQNVGLLEALNPGAASLIETLVEGWLEDAAEAT